MSERLLVHARRGARDEEDRAVDRGLSQLDGVEVRVKDVLDVRPDARGATTREVVLDDDDVLETRDSSGWVDFTRVSTLRGRADQQRLAADGPLDLAALLARGDVRGTGDLTAVAAFAVDFPRRIVEQLDLLGRLASEAIDMAADPVARAAARQVIEWLERTVADDDIGPGNDGRAKSHGLYRVGADLALTADRRLGADEQIVADQTLVLLHGTFSSTEGAFSALRRTREWSDLVDHYPGGVVSLEHPTLSVSPIANALTLARHLPRGAHIDMVSHSRGGLVGDLVALAAAGALDPSVLRGHGRAAVVEQQEQLDELVAVLRGQDVTVGGFVRIAAPARGTVMASARIDELATFLFNVVPRSTGPLRWIATVLKALVLAFLDQRTDARVIPGIEAMMPSSPLTRLLNLSGPTDDRLGVIAGDVDRSRWMRWFLEKGADLFFGQDHDYVVDTLSMSQGARRRGGGLSLHAGPDVNHFTYFRQASSRHQIVSWLTSDADRLPAGFEPLDRTPAIPVGAARDAGAGGAARVVLVPDVFGTSLLDRDGTLVWPDPLTIGRRGVEALITGDLVAGDVLSDAYGPLAERLANGWSVATVPYDWRGSLQEASQAVLSSLEADDGPIGVVAHGVGATVVERALASADDEVRERITATVLLGAAGGDASPLNDLVAGRGRLVEDLLLLDPSMTPADIASLFRSLPLVAAAVAPAAGPSGAATIGRDPGPPVVQVVAGASGAGTSPRTGLLVDAAHGDLATAHEVLASIDDLLQRGRTHRLAPVPRGRVDPATTVREHTSTARTPRLFPTRRSLEQAALAAAESVTEAATPAPVVEVEAIHGDLRFAHHPVVVGHYAGSTFEGAERVLDAALGDRLTVRDVLGTYPGPVGTAEVVLAADAEVPGAVVIGLGEVGRLSGSVIAAGVTEGAVRLAMRQLEVVSGGTDDRAAPVALAISSVLVGTTGAANLSIDLSVGAVLRGVAAANHRLANLDLPRSVRFGRVQFVELYEDIAIETVRAIQRIATGTTDVALSTDTIVAAPLLGTIEGGKPGRPPMSYDAGSWRPIMVETVPGGSVSRGGGSPDGDDLRSDLVFTSSSMAARSEQIVHPRQRVLVDRIVEKLVHSRDLDPRLGHTLYQLLVPNHIKGSTGESDNILLSLDSEASRLPWEMLSIAGPDGDLQPIATRSGVIRRLLSPVTSDRHVSSGTRALVVGDPPSQFNQLDGAVREAQAVAARLGGSHEVTSLIRGEEAFGEIELMNELFAAEYRIVHIAAHGVYTGTPETSGVVIGDGVLLTGIDLRQLQTVPPLVFFNCCHLGTQDTAYNELAASVSQELIRQGARGVVAAGWAVDDAAALTFATTFYDEMLRGISFGDAVRTARQRTYTDHPQSTTWGAYQCYGDPGFRLTTQRRRPPDSSAVSPVDLERRLRDKADEVAHGPDPATVARVHAAVDQALREIPSTWRTGRVMEAAGDAYAGCDDHEAAIECFEEALRHVDANASLGLVQRLVDLEGRLAEQLAVASPAPDEHAVDELFDSAISRLDGLMKIVHDAGPAQLRLRAAHHRRVAAVHLTDHDVLMANLGSARSAYRAAMDRSMPTVDPDSSIGWGLLVTLEAAASDDDLGPERTGEIRIAVERALESAARREQSRPSLRNRVARPDAQLLLGMIEGDLQDREHVVVTGYRDALGRRSTSRDRSSALAHLRFVAAVLRAVDRTATADSCERILHGLRHGDGTGDELHTVVTVPDLTTPAQ